MFLLSFYWKKQHTQGNRSGCVVIYRVEEPNPLRLFHYVFPAVTDVQSAMLRIHHTTPLQVGNAIRGRLS